MSQLLSPQPTPNFIFNVQMNWVHRLPHGFVPPLVPKQNLWGQVKHALQLDAHLVNHTIDSVKAPYSLNYCEITQIRNLGGDAKLLTIIYEIYYWHSK